MIKWRVLDAFAHLGTAAVNRYAWSAQSVDGSVTAISLWTDEVIDDGHTVSVDLFGLPNMSNWINRRGNKTRKKHISTALERDGLFKVVMLTAKDVRASPRTAVGRWPDDRLTMKILEFDHQTGEFRAEGTRSSI